MRIFIGFMLGASLIAIFYAVLLSHTRWEAIMLFGCGLVAIDIFATAFWS